MKNRGGSDIGSGLDLLDSGERPRSARGTHRVRRIAAVLVIGLLTLTLGAAGFVMWLVHDALSSIARDPDLLPSSSAGSSVVQSDDPLALLVVGLDAHETTPGRSDVLMLVFLPAARDKLYVISFPRDLYVDIPGRGKDKINAAQAYGGVSLAARTVESLVGVRVNHAAVIDFDGFVSLSSAVGGVTVWNETNSTSDGYRFPRGTVHLEGAQLLAYVRQRHDLPGGDLDRAKRQRLVLKALVGKLATREVLTNPQALRDLAARLGKYMTLDAGLTDEAIVDIGLHFHLNRLDDVVTMQAPVEGFGTSPSGAAIDIVDSAGMADLAEALQADAMGAYLSSHPAVVDQ